jgi:hypothetical protein
VVGAAVVGAAVVGAEVVGAEVVGALVVGAAVVGAEVVGAAILGTLGIVGSNPSFKDRLLITIDNERTINTIKNNENGVILKFIMLYSI